jgi:O-antigen ligase
MLSTSNIQIQKIGVFLIYFYPISIVIGPAVAETIILLSILFYVKLIKKNFKLLYKINIFQFLIYFYIYLIVCSLLGFDSIYSLKSSLPYIRFILFTFIVYLLLIENKMNHNILFWSLFSLILFLIIDLLVQFKFGSNLFGFEKVGHFRYGGMFNDELILGSYLVKIFPVFLTFLYIKNNKNNDYFCIFSLLILIFITLLTGERTSFVLSILLFLIILIYLKIKLIHKSLILLISLLIGLVFLNLDSNNNVKDRMINSPLQSIFKNKDKDIVIFTENHEKLYKTSFKMFLDSPVIGHGPKSFRKICKLEKFYIEEKEVCQTHPHNIYLQMLLETGIIGFLFIISLMMHLFKMIFKKDILINNQKDKKILFILSISLCVNLFPFAPTGNFFNNFYSMLLYFILPYLLFFRTKLKIK